jgi:tryptophan-rich sensory protein
VAVALALHRHLFETGQTDAAFLASHTTGAEQLRILLLFGANIFFYMLWSPLFFNLRRPDWALIEIPFLWLSIVALMLWLAPLSATSAWLLLPYVLWVTFAAFLNLRIVRMNRPFHGLS